MNKVVDMCLCEFGKLVPQPKTTHRPIYMVGCEACEKIAAAQIEAYGSRSPTYDEWQNIDAVLALAAPADWLPIVPGMSIKRAEWDAMSVEQRRALLNEAPAVQPVGYQAAIDALSFQPAYAPAVAYLRSLSTPPAESVPDEKSKGWQAAAAVNPGEIAYQLTKRLVIDMPTARAAVDAAISQSAAADKEGA